MRALNRRRMVRPAAVGLLLAWCAAVHASAECRYAIERHAVPDAAESARLQSLRVGEIQRQAVPALARLRNLGPHDIRATFEGAAPRVLARAQAEPAHGVFVQPVALLSVECLAAKSARGVSPQRLVRWTAVEP